MTNASETEGRERGRQTHADPLFPSDGDFSPVVPLSQIGGEAAHRSDAPASAAPEEQDEATLVPARAGTRKRPAHPPPAPGVEQSRALLAAVIVLSVAAGVIAGAFMVRSPRPAPPAGGEVVGTVPAPESAETSVAQPPEPAPRADEAGLAAPPVAPPEEAGAKVEREDVPARPAKVSPPAAESSARRAAEPEPRAERRTRAASEPREASPAPRPARADTSPRRTAATAERRQPTPASPPVSALPVSSPPPSAKSKKVIQWP